MSCLSLVLQLSLSVQRELTFLLILEELGEEVPHSVLKVNLALSIRLIIHELCLLL